MMESVVARVCVSLERYFDDERARVLLTVTRGSVGDLAQRLRTCFGLPGAFCLTSGGMLLPPEEPHTLLRDGDHVEVVPLRDPWPPWDAQVSVDLTSASGAPRALSSNITDDLELRKREALMMLALAEGGKFTHNEGSGSPGSHPSQGEGCLLQLEEGSFSHQEGNPHRRKRLRKRPRKVPLEPGPICTPQPVADSILEFVPPVVNVHIRFPAESSTVQQNGISAGPGRVVHALPPCPPTCL